MAWFLATPAGRQPCRALNATVLTDRLLAAGNEAHAQTRLAAASCWFSQAVLIGETRRIACERTETEWPPAWQNDLAAVYQNRGIALEKGGQAGAAIADWQAAAALQAVLAGKGSFGASMAYLTLQRWVLEAAVTAPDWEAGAGALLAFMASIVALWRAAEEAVEAGAAEAEARPWQGEVDAFLGLVHKFDAAQRDRLLDRLAEEDAAWVAASLGWSQEH